MPSVDVVDVLEKLGAEKISEQRDEVWALCPDHKLFVARESSDPNWSVNVDTGETNCFTEGRGSNLLWTACRVLGCDPREGVKFLTGIEGDVNMSALQLSSLSRRLGKMKSGREKKVREAVFGLDDVREDMVKGFRPEGMYEFFMTPPGKRYSTDIVAATVDRYQVFQRTWGYYKDRAIVPFFLKGKLVGYCAIDTLGLKGWLRNNPLKTEGEYKKSLYPLNFLSSEYLFGFDDCQKGAEYVILTEGPREVMKLWQEGFTNTVAIMGGRVLDGQIRLLTELAPKRILLMFDGDSKGRQFNDDSEKILSRLFPIGKIMTPWNRDPKNLDREALEKLINSAV
jgi:5S rRNA maturation endonuclease (ribonuclease M5)